MVVRVAGPAAAPALHVGMQLAGVGSALLQLEFARVES
jgi:hypothetical protein